MYYDVNVITEKMKQMFPKPLEKMYYNEIIDAIKKDKKYGFRHIALKIMVDGLEERTRDYKKYIDLQKEYFVLKHKCKRELNDILWKMEQELAELKQKAIVIEKAFELACDPRDDWGGEKYSGTEFNNYHDYFIAKAKQKLTEIGGKDE